MNRHGSRYLVCALTLMVLSANVFCIEAAESSAAHAHSLSMDHASRQHHDGKMPSMEHAAHRAAMKKSRYSVTTEQYRIPTVTLVDQSGVPVVLAELLQSDSPVAMNFIFTTCSTICPVMTATFARMRQALGEEGEQLRMVSVSIDPEYDRPEVLKRYAEKFHADGNWIFLTGDGKDISVVLQAFKNSFGSKMNHQPVTLLKKPGDSSWIRIDGLAKGADLAREVKTRLLN